MAELACAVCGKTFEESELLFHDRGKVCAMCELELDEESQKSRGMWLTIVSAPVTALTGTVMLCVPYVGMFLAFVFGAMALWRSTVALQVAWMSREDEGTGDVVKFLLVGSGAISLMWAVGVVLAAGIQLLVFLWSTMA